MTIPAFKPGPQRQESSVAIAACGAVLLLLGGTRWASYLGANPLFLTDMLLLAAAVHWALSRLLRRDKFTGPHSTGGLPRLQLVLAVYVLARMAVGQQFDLVALRDAAPYLYSLVGLLAWESARWASEASQERTRKFLVWSLGFHAAWFFTVILFAPTLPSAMPLLSAAQGIHIFTPRADIDTALVGVLAAILLGRLIRGAAGSRWVTIFLFSCCWAAVLSTSSRAGLLGAMAANVYVIYASLRSQKQHDQRKLVTLALIPLVGGTALFVLPMTDIGTRLFATMGVASDSSDELALGAAGTAYARSQSWDRLLEWTVSDPSRFLWGEGVGPNIMALSGADVLLVGSADEPEVEPRSPHNYWIGSFARLGFVGLILLLLMGCSLLLASVRRAEQIGSDELKLILIIIPLSLIAPATLGVVLESPFGAIPFFWCLGALAGLVVQKPATSMIHVRNS